MKHVKYSRHAKRRMSERGVNEEEAALTIDNPELMERSVKDRKNAYRFINGRFLRVTFKENDDHILVITVTIRKRPYKE